MKTCIIVNPNAGSVEDLATVESALGVLPETTIRITNAAGDAETFAREAVEGGAELVVAAGGDGTVNEVVNGMAVDFGRAALGLLPLGTGNDFARSIGVPADLEEALEILGACRIEPLDVGRAQIGETGRYFVNASAGGFSGTVNEKMNPELKRAWGPLSYFRSAMEALPELSGFDSVITVNRVETLELKTYSIVVSNARYVASGIPVAPEARLDDGLLDVMIVPESTVPQITVIVPQVLLGLHLGSDLLLVRRATRLEVRSEPPMWFNVDGELLGNEPAVFEVLPRALRVVVGSLE